MNQVQINKKIEQLAVDYSSYAFSVGYTKPPKVSLQKLHDKLQPKKYKEYRAFILKIIDNYDEILKAKPSQIEALNKDFKPLIAKIDLKAKVENKKLAFYESIVNAMRYDDVREKEFLPYLRKLNLKTCVYCQTQLAVVIDFQKLFTKSKKTPKVVKAKLELDHYFPKSKFPHLSTAFFNLYPVCGNCNKAKSDNGIGFALYTEIIPKDLFKFRIDDASIIRYWTSYNHEDLKIHFDGVGTSKKVRDEYNNMFDIQGIYDSQKDVAEELVYKAKVYTPKYRQVLLQEFQTLLVNQDILGRLIIGNYTLPEDVHKRPMAKFTQDIAKQLKLI